MDPDGGRHFRDSGSKTTCNRDSGCRLESTSRQLWRWLRCRKSRLAKHAFVCNDGLMITLSLSRPASSAWKMKIAAAGPGENQARRSVIGSRQVRVAWCEEKQLYVSSAYSAELYSAFTRWLIAFSYCTLDYGSLRLNDTAMGVHSKASCAMVHVAAATSGPWGAT